MKKNYFFYFFLVFLLILSLISFIYYSKIEKSVVEKYPNLRFVKYLFKSESLVNKISNDYNVDFLPNTEFIKLNFEKKKNKF